MRLKLRGLVVALGSMIVLTAHAGLSEGRYAALGQVLKEDRVFYRWQSTESGENLARAGVMTKALDAYFMNLKHGIVAGPGIYLAHDPASSSGYMPRSGGNLLEVRVPKGTRLIDLSDTATTVKMSLMRLSETRLENGSRFGPGVVLKYDDSYYVAKNLPGKIKFDFFPGPHVTPAEIVAAYRAIPEAAGRQQMMAQVGSRRPELLDEMARTPANLDVAIDGRPVAEATEVVRKVRARVTTPDEARQVWANVAVHPKLTRAIAADPALRPSLHADMQDLLRLRDKGVNVISRGHVPLLETLFDHPETKPAEAAAIRRTLLDVHLKDPAARVAPEDLANSIKPLLAHMDLASSERVDLIRDLNRLADELEEHITPSPGLVDVAKLGHVNDPRLVARLEHVQHRRALIDAAEDRSGSLRPAAEALRSSANAREWLTTYQALEWGQTSHHVIQGAVKDIVTNEPARYASLFRTAKDVDGGLHAAFLIDDDAVHRATYHAAREANVLTRTAYLHLCVVRTSCRQAMLPLIAADGGRIFAGVRDFEPMFKANAPYEDGAKYLRRLLPLMMKAAESNDQFAAIVKQLPADGLDAGARRIVADAARARGLNTFRTEELVDLRRFATASSVSADAFTRAAINAAVAPGEVLAVAKTLREAPARGVGINVALEARLHQVGARAQDFDEFRSVGLVRPFARETIATEDDCLNALARLVAP